MRVGAFATLGLLVVMGCGGGAGGADAALPDVPGDVAPDTPGDVTGDATADAASDPGGVDPGPDLPPYHEPAAHVQVDLSARPIKHLFPNDYYVDPATGGIVLDSEWQSNDLLPWVSQNYVFKKAFKATIGFTPYAPFLFETSVPVDPACLPADGAASREPGSAVQLILRDEGGAPVERLGLRVSFETVDSKEGPHHTVTAVPLRPVPSGSRVLFVVTDALRASDGSPFGMSAGFAALAGVANPGSDDPALLERVARERARLAPLLARLDVVGGVAAAADVTIGTGTLESADLFREFLPGGRYDRDVVYRLDGDADGTDDVVPGASFTDCKLAEGMAYGVAGVFEPLNLTGPDNAFAQKEDGSYQEFAPERVGFWLMVPEGPGPFPVAIAQHGIDATHGAMCGPARELVQVGVAVLRFDWPRHGDRGGGGIDFLDVSNPFKVRDNFRQSSLDLLSAQRLLVQLAAGLDLLPWGAPDGAPDLVADRIAYLGMSLGGILGFAAIPFSDRIPCAVGAVTGEGLYHMVEVAIEDKLPMFDRWTLLGVVRGAEHLIGTGDGVNYVPRLLTNTQPDTLPERHALVFEAMGDTTVPNSSTDALARAAGLPLIAPIAAPIDEVPVVEVDATTSGIVQFTGVMHNFFECTTEGPQAMPETIRARAMAVHYLSTCLQTGTPEIVRDP